MSTEDVAKLYEVTPVQFLKQVNKNPGRFPSNFMFRLTKHEQAILKTEYENVFTQEGILMAGGILKSKKANKVQVQLIRHFADLYKQSSIEMENETPGVFEIFEILKQMMKK